MIFGKPKGSFQTAAESPLGETLPARGSAAGRAPRRQPQHRGSRASHLHPIVLVIHVLQPGNELPRVETVSDRFVFVSLSKRQQKGIRREMFFHFKQSQV